MSYVLPSRDGSGTRWAQVYVRLRPPGDGSNAVDPRFMERFPGNSKKVGTGRSRH